MSTDEISAGIQFVEAMLRQVCANRGVALDSVEWGQGPNDFDRGLHSMAYTIGGKRRLEKFSMEELSDAPGDKTVRGKLQPRIVDLVNKAVPNKRIGF